MMRVVTVAVTLSQASDAYHVHVTSALTKIQLN